VKLNFLLSFLLLAAVFISALAVGYAVYHALQIYFSENLLTLVFSFLVVVALFTACFQIACNGANFKSCFLFGVIAIAVGFLSSTYLHGMLAGEHESVEKSLATNYRLPLILHSSVAAILPFASAAMPLFLVAIYSKATGTRGAIGNIFARVSFPSYELIWKYLAATLFCLTFVVALIWFANPDKNYEPTIVLLTISMVGLELFRRN